MERLPGSRPTVKFLHVPKTAGTSVRFFLSGFFPRREICPAIHPHEFREIPPAQLRRYRLFAGHYDWRLLDAVGGDCFTFTVLRHPVERLLSYYFFQRRQGQRLRPGKLSKPENQGFRAAMELPPDEYFCDDSRWDLRRHIDDLNDNFYAYYFAGRSFGARGALEGQDGDAVVAQALSNLRGLDRIYLTDDLSVLEREITALLGATNGPPPLRELRSRLLTLRRIRMHVGRGDADERLKALGDLGATSRTLDRLHDMTRLDLEIWSEILGWRDGPRHGLAQH